MSNIGFLFINENSFLKKATKFTIKLKIQKNINHYYKFIPVSYLNPVAILTVGGFEDED